MSLWCSAVTKRNHTKVFLHYMRASALFKNTFNTGSQCPTVAIQCIDMIDANAAITLLEKRTEKHFQAFKAVQWT